jgi:hypothetical protein
VKTTIEAYEFPKLIPMTGERDVRDVTSIGALSAIPFGRAFGMALGTGQLISPTMLYTSCVRSTALVNPQDDIVDARRAANVAL